MTNDEIAYVKRCIRENRVHDFYIWRKWKAKRIEILERDHYECQECKRRGKYTRAVLVHHVKHLREYPELALCDTYKDESGNDIRQLISVCKDCHENVFHPERLRKRQKSTKFWIEELWD